MKPSSINYLGLCHRCEHRARFFETGHGPRCECQTPGYGVCSCYMYEPVTPLEMTLNEREKRPPIGIVGWGLSGRAHSIKLADVDLHMEMTGKRSYITYKTPKKCKTGSKKIKSNTATRRAG